MNMRPGVLLQLGHQALPDHCIGRADFELRARSRQSLDDIGPAYDANKVAAIAHDWNALDVISLKKIRNFVEWRVGLSGLDVLRHDVLYFHRVRLDVFLGDSAFAGNER